MARSSLQGILANSGWLLFDKVVRLALGVLVGAWVARYLGPESFGELSYAVAYIALFQTVATLGLDGIVIRDIARNPPGAGDILGTTFILRVLAGALCWAIALGVLALSKGIDDPYVFLSAIMGMNLIFQAGDAVDLWFQSQMQSRRTVLSKLCASIASNMIKVLLIYLRAPLVMFAAVLVFEIAAGAGALAFVYRRFPSPSVWRYRAVQARKLLVESWPFIIAGAVNMVQARVEFVMIESFLGAAALGQYAAAARFIEVFDMVFASLSVSIFPRISSQEGEQSQTAIRRVYLLAVLTYLSVVPMLCVVWLFIGVIYGKSYGPARELFPYMALRPLLAYIGLTKSMAIRLSFKSRYALFSSAIGFILLPRFGLRGAVAASLSSYFLSNFLIDAVFYKSNFRDAVSCWKEWPYFMGIIKGAVGAIRR